jgi:hypothetical protein
VSGQSCGQAALTTRRAACIFPDSMLVCRE